jgi:plastocyanin
MSNWDLMMPGMGLTAIGIAGVFISYAEIAHTFVDGMHALTGLTMMFGLIFLSAGILEGGVSTSNKAKATTLVILGISLSFGVVAIASSSISTVPVFVGIMLIIAIPAIIIAYVAVKNPSYAKPVSIIFILASGSAIAAYIGFGLVGPSPYLKSENDIVVEQVEEIIASETPVFSISILPGSSQQGAPDYEPDEAHVTSGMMIEWTNDDNVAHTVTSSVDFGETFDSGLMDPAKKFLLDTSKLGLGQYEYMCIVHPWMIATIIIEESVEQSRTEVVIPQGASLPPPAPGEVNVTELNKKYYDPQDVSISVGTTVVWKNNDNTMHTVTSGTPSSGPDGKFDSGIMNAGTSFEHTFTISETVDYYCIVHPWMEGTVTVG